MTTPIPRMTPEEIRLLVDDYVADKVFTTGHFPSDEYPPLIHDVFVGLPWTSVPEAIGGIYAYYERAEQAEVWSPFTNLLYPRFAAGNYRIVHSEDWFQFVRGLERKEKSN